MSVITQKLIVIGDGAIGKTCLLIRYATNSFPDEYVPTVFDNYAMEPEEVDGQQIRLGLWDTGGGEDYHRLRPLSYPQTDVFLLCYSVESRHSFERVPTYWMPEVTHHCPKVHVILCANKIDLRNDKETREDMRKKDRTMVEREEGIAMAERIKAYAYVECSARLGIGVKKVFQQAMSAGLLSEPSTYEKRKRCMVL